MDIYKADINLQSKRAAKIEENYIDPKRVFTKETLYKAARAIVDENLRTGKINQEEFEKAIAQLESLEKGGEGSRGGKVIGHTRSGKPIYDTFGHESHKDFTADDHADASSRHMEIYQKTKSKGEAVEKQGGAKNAGETYKNVAKKHGDASIAHKDEYIKKLTGDPNWKPSPSGDIKKAYETLGLEYIEKAGGEGSRGGHIIGHTSSGKPIYESGKHSHYGNFHESDHYEASREHSKLAESARVKKNSHETLRSMAESEKNREGVKEHAAKVKEYSEKEMHHSAQTVYHEEEARPKTVRDRYSDVGKRVEGIRSK